jgi:RNA polymerase sigma-70 factor (ECF subfamily)
MIATSLSLLDRLKAGGASADWRRLAAIYRPWIVGWGCRQGLTETDAEDLAQDVFVVVLRELAFFRHNQRAGAFRNWLRAITAHRLQEAVRSRRYRPRPESDDNGGEQFTQLQDSDSELSRLWDDEHDRYVIGRLLALIESEFEPRTWQAFRAVMLEGEKPAATAERLGVSVNAVLLAKSRILARLRQEAGSLVNL